MDTELYDKVSKVLTWYEHPTEYPFYDKNNKADFIRDISYDMYKLLVEIQNKMAEENDIK